MWAAALWVGAAASGFAGLSALALHCRSQVTVTSPVAASEAPALGSSSFLAVCTAASSHTPTWVCPGVSDSGGPSTKVLWVLSQSSTIKSEEERIWAKIASTNSYTLPLVTLRCSHRSDNSEGFKDQQRWGSVVVQDLKRLHHHPWASCLAEDVHLARWLVLIWRAPFPLAADLDICNLYQESFLQLYLLVQLLNRTVLAKRHTFSAVIGAPFWTMKFCLWAAN